MRLTSTVKIDEFTKEIGKAFDYEFTGESSLVKVTVLGTKKVVDVKIDAESLEKDDIDMLQDMIMVAINDANKKIDDETEKKMAKFGSIPGLF